MVTFNFVLFNFNTFSFILVLQNNFSYSTLQNRVNCEKQILQEEVGSNPTEGKICFSLFTLFCRVECEKLFCKTNIKLKVLKLNKTKFI